MSEFRTVAQFEDVPENALLGVELDGVSIVLANSDGDRWSAFYTARDSTCVPGRQRLSRLFGR